MTARAYITPKQKALVMLRQDGKCKMCGEKLQLGKYDWDHIQALVHGGDNALDNWRAICRQPCHRGKTKADVQGLAKAKRIAKGGKTKRGPSIPGSRDTKWKRTFGGKTVVRQKSRERSK